MDEVQWFPRFTAIPGVQYTPPPGIDVQGVRSRYQLTPRINRYEFGSSLSWGNTSASPAQQHALSDPSRPSTSEVLVNLAEALELPGEPSHYHFALQRAAGVLWGRRRQSREMLSAVEHFCWLDLQLVQAVPSAVSSGPDGAGGFYYIEAFDRLLDMYLRDGLLADAVGVAEIAERFGAGELTRAREARERFASVAAEDERS
ncbi:hypothetical protein [Streptacidiphilus sp. EB103A]|uniref:hypothetical protein n=1 Tax=Streptacidiphilus sp. EB103A TaxID=3156275 RepID=UPI0035137311